MKTPRHGLPKTAKPWHPIQTGPLPPYGCRQYASEVLLEYGPMSSRSTEEQVRHVAKLARLRLSDQDVHQMTAKLSAVLGYVSKLNELNVEGVEPMAHAMEMSNVLREDVAEPGMAVEKVLAN